jgi:hypothetical protein
MLTLTAPRLKWFCFFFTLTLHIFLTWKAFQFDWSWLVIAAIGPVLIFDAPGLSSCHQFICFPNAAGLTFCLVVWSGIHYFAAKPLSTMLLHMDAKSKS